MLPVNFNSFRQKVRLYKKIFKRFLSKIEKKPPRGLDKMTVEINAEVWKEVDCLSCANCCKKMTPTFTIKDIKRASTYLGMKPSAFKAKWLRYEKKDDDWVNVSQPCQFLDLTNNMCSIYEARPADCAGFPHLTKKKMVDYIHIHQQNINYCPATYKMVEKLMERFI
jgi:Fe-S-cluster containining protein